MRGTLSRRAMTPVMSLTDNDFAFTLRAAALKEKEKLKRRMRIDYKALDMQLAVAPSVDVKDTQNEEVLLSSHVTTMSAEVSMSSHVIIVSAALEDLDTE